MTYTIATLFMEVQFFVEGTAYLLTGLKPAGMEGRKRLYLNKERVHDEGGNV